MLSEAEITGMRDTVSGALPDTGVISRPAPAISGTLDNTTGTLSPEDGTEIWTGACRVRPQSNNRESVNGEKHVEFSTHVATIAWDASFTARESDRLVVTFADGSPDAEYRVLDVAPASWNLGWRLVLQRVQ